MHPYGELPEEQDVPIRRLQEYLRSRGKSSVIWQSECGFPSSADTAGWGFGGAWDETKHAKWVLRRMLSDAALGARASIYFVLTDYPAALEGGPDRGKLGVNRKGLYAAGSWKPKPAAYAYRHLAALVNDRLTIKPITLDLQVLGNGTLGTIASENIRTLTFIDTNTCLPVVVYWLPVAMQTEIKAASIRLTLTADSLPNEPVLVDLLDGRVYRPVCQSSAVGKMTFENLPLADSPLILCSRTTVELLEE